MNIKRWLTDFPSQGANAAVAVFLIVCTGLVIIARLAIGKDFPEGYDSWLILLGSLAGVSTAGMIGKRLSNIEYKAAKRVPAVNVEQADQVITKSTKKKTIDEEVFEGEDGG